MRFRPLSEKETSKPRPQPRSWFEISILIILAAAILRLGGELSSQWRLAADRIGLVEADLHAIGKADYSTDPLDAIIPPISPAILEDILGLLSPPWETPDVTSVGNLNSPVGPPGEPTAILEITPTITPTSQAPDQTEWPIDTANPTETLAWENTFTPTPTSSQASVVSATPTRTVFVTPTPTRSPTRTPTTGISPTRTPSRTPAVTISPSRTPTPTPKPDTPTPKPDTPTPEPDTPTPKPDTPTPKPDTPTPEPDTPTPKPKTPTPFVTRDPTRALTPTGNYTPGGTSAPTTPEPPGKAVGEASGCEYLVVGLPAEVGCVAESSWIMKSSDRSLWQVLLDFFGLDFGRGMVYLVSGQ